jgi:hypothetical protein
MFLSQLGRFGLGSKTGHGLFVEGWVEHPDIFCWVSAPCGGPTYLPAIFVLSTKPNKKAQKKNDPVGLNNCNRIHF